MMKRRSFLTGLLTSFWGVRAAQARFPRGTPASTSSFNPVVVATEAHVFGMDPSDTTNYYVPGMGQPAISTSTYYNMFGMYGFRPYDLDAMGSAGAAVKAANGGKRYVWVCGSDHPAASAGFRGGCEFVIGYSSQPWDLPAKLESIIIGTGTNNTASHTVSGGFNSYEYTFLGYNPDDVDGKPFHLFVEAGPAHYTALWTSSDCVTWTLKEISHYNDSSTSGGGKWSSFVRYFRRNSANNITTVALSTPGNGQDSSVGVCNSLWTTTDGINYTSSYVAILGMEGSNDSAGSNYGLGGNFTVGSQLYALARENASGGSQYATIYPMDSTTLDKQSSPAKVRLTAAFTGTFPGPTFLQEVKGYEEDGILYALPTYGFPSDVNTTAGGAGRGGAPYSGGGGLDQQFIDKLVVRVDDVASRQAAPVGMSVSCVSGTATISWKDALPQNTYRLYRGTSSATQATLVGDYTGVTSATDSPSIGRYWYKLVTLDSGTERKSRILSVYVSSSSAFVNQHIDRVLEDGGDSSTINRAFLDRADAMLDTVGIRSILEIWTHPAFGCKLSGSVITKVYDLGTTRLPRSDDLKPTTSATTYSATSVNTGPGWTNANNNSYAYWGSTKRGNTINQKRQITILAAYERTQTTDDITFMGTGPIFGTSLTGNSIIALKHTAGSPGNIEFSLSDETSTKTASVAASGSGMQIAVGTYDGTSMLAYTGSTAGSAVTTLDPNPDFGRTSGTPGWISSSLAGSRNTNNGGSSPDFGGSPFPAYYPFLGSGSVHNYTLRRGQNSGVADVVNFNEANAKFKGQTIMQLGGAINSTKIGQLITELQSTANW